MFGIGKIIDFFIGKASFEIKIRDHRDVLILNHLKSAGFYGCKVSEGTIDLSCSCRDTGKIVSVLDEHDMEYSCSRSGLLWFLKRLIAHRGVLCGIAVCIAAHAVFSDMIWQINITGNNSIPEKDIREMLYSLGVSEGARKSGIDVKKLYIDYMLADERVSWAHLNLTGTTADFEVSERTASPKHETDKKAVGNIVAKCDGIIHRIDVYSGGREVENGESVVEGQLLISSFFETRMAGYLLRRAKGTVLAKTEPVFEMRIPKEAYKISSVTKHEKHSINILGFSVPVDGGNILLKGKKTQLETRKKELSLFGLIKLPAVYETKIYTLNETERYQRSLDEAKAIYEKSLHEWKSLYSENAEMISENTEMREEDGYFCFVTRFECIESIGIDKPFEIREN